MTTVVTSMLFGLLAAAIVAAFSRILRLLGKSLLDTPVSCGVSMAVAEFPALYLTAWLMQVTPWHLVRGEMPDWLLPLPLGAGTGVARWLLQRGQALPSVPPADTNG
jgi:hypothetical protein